MVEVDIAAFNAEGVGEISPGLRLRVTLGTLKGFRSGFQREPGMSRALVESFGMWRVIDLHILAMLLMMAPIV